MAQTLSNDTQQIHVTGYFHWDGEQTVIKKGAPQEDFWELNSFDSSSGENR